jgi:hypothetical protein
MTIVLKFVVSCDNLNLKENFQVTFLEIMSLFYNIWKNLQKSMFVLSLYN